MKLQISFDMPDLEKAIQIAQSIKDYCDIFEVGTILIHKYGIKAVEEFTKAFPDKDIMADTKIIDRGKDITNLYSHTNITWLTVMAGTSNNVIHRVCSEAQDHRINVMLDMVDSEAPGQSALEAKNLGVDAILFHQAYDTKESLVFLENLDMVQGNTDLPIFISAKINRNNIDKIMETKPYGIVVGKSITEAEEPLEEAKFYYNLCKNK
ncbi:orotidine 5'-phosphate decarboxylase / HUMPS family protein [Candidatus Dependentiae bacterium]